MPSDLAPLSPVDLRSASPVVERELELAVGRRVGAVTRPSPPTHIAIPDAGVSAAVESVGATRPASSYRVRAARAGGTAARGRARWAAR